MAQYSSGILTRQRILDVCKDLFYNKGYTDTTYKEICSKAKVHPGSIGYHFNGKKSIAAEVYREIMSYFITRPPQLFHGEDELTYLILQLSCYQRVFYDDASYRRFCIEYELENLYDSHITEYKNNVSNVYQFVLKKVGEKKANFYFAAYSAMDKGTQTYIDKNIDSLTFEEAVRFTNELYYSFIPNEELNEKIERALELIKKLEFKNEGFETTIKLKDSNL